MLSPEHWGDGLFFAAAPAVVDFAFDVLGVHRLEARAAVHNGRGNGALRKIGAVQEGVLRRSLQQEDGWADQALWTLIADDWRKRMGRQETCTELRAYELTSYEYGSDRDVEPMHVTRYSARQSPGTRSSSLVARRCYDLVVRLSDFDFSLPDHLIAQQPPAQRGASRLLVVDRVGRHVERSDDRGPAGPAGSLRPARRQQLACRARAAARPSRAQRRSRRVPAAASDRRRSMGRADASRAEDETGHARPVWRATCPTRSRSPRAAHVRPPHGSALADTLRQRLGGRRCDRAHAAAAVHQARRQPCRSRAIPDDFCAAAADRWPRPRRGCT